MKYSRKLLIQLYRSMLEIRLTEESFIEPILNREVFCPCHLYSGEEAIAAGICANLKTGDYVFGNHRSHGHFLAKGGSIEDMVAEIYCRESGCARGRGGSMHLVDPDVGMMGSAPIVSGTISLALGAALASSIRGENRVAVSFFGDGATGEGVLYECLNYASLRKLPIVFVCENNLYATHMPIRECRTDSIIAKIGEPFCIESCRGDGNNILEVYDIAKKAVEKCRKGRGPVFIEFLTYRFRGHVGPDDNIQGTHTDIRPKAEIAKWRKRDPITFLERYLVRNHFLDRKSMAELRNEIMERVRTAHENARESRTPGRKDLMKYVFA